MLSTASAPKLWVDALEDALRDKRRCERLAYPKAEHPRT
jgi:hypothetical protein